MQTLESDFAEQTSEQWWKIIEKELKGQARESLYKTWLEGMIVPPFHSWEQARNTKALFSEGIWRSAEVSDSNKALLESLNRGAEAFVLKTKASDLKENLAGVQLNFLFGWYETQEPKALTEAYTQFLE